MHSNPFDTVRILAEKGVCGGLPSLSAFYLIRRNNLMTPTPEYDNQYRRRSVQSSTTDENTEKELHLTTGGRIRDLFLKWFTRFNWAVGITASVVEFALIIAFFYSPTTQQSSLILALILVALIIVSVVIYELIVPITIFEIKRRRGLNNIEAQLEDLIAIEFHPCAPSTLTMDDASRDSASDGREITPRSAPAVSVSKQVYTSPMDRFIKSTNDSGLSPGDPDLVVSKGV